MKRLKVLRLIAGLAVLATTALGQQNLTYDLRDQVKPRSDEARDALNFRMVISTATEAPPEAPLMATIHSIAPINKSTAQVEVAFENTGRTPYRFPVSLEGRLLHMQGNTDRRSLSCSLNLFDNDGAASEASGFTTYTSFLDNNSWVVIPPRQTLILTFEADFRPLFGFGPRTGLGDWQQRLRNGNVMGQLNCVQTFYKPVSGNELDRTYSINGSLLKPSNLMPVAMAP